MVLQDVAERPRLLVEGATSLNADRLCHGDLYMVNVAAVPDWLEDQVAEAEDQDVAHRLFPQVVINAIDLALAEDLAYLAVQFHR